MSCIYIHIPFCKTRCIYCDFFSTTQLELRKQYVDAVCKEIELTDKYLDGDTIHSIYFGGGTPSQLDTTQIGRILNTVQAHHSIVQNCETTIELNPDDATSEYVESLSSLPVNRVSLGIQTFNDNTLRFIHRRHTSQQAIDAVRRLQNHGFSNISIDLMFGFPGETLELTSCVSLVPSLAQSEQSVQLLSLFTRHMCSFHSQKIIRLCIH